MAFVLLSAYASQNFFTAYSGVSEIPPPIPVLISPPDGDILDEPQPVLVWQEVHHSFSVNYIARLVDKTTPEIPIELVSLSLTSASPINPLPNGQYQWHVQAVDILGNPSGFSAPFSFTINLFLPSDPIVWNKDRPLTWDDFKGTPDNNAKEDAEVSTTVHSDAQFEGTEGGPITVTSVSTTATMEPDQSWVKDGKKTDDLLNHEQGHFDIAQIFALKKQQEMLGLVGKEFKDEAALQQKIDEICKKNDEDRKKMNDDYDKQTEHGTDKKKQEDWNKKIQKDLENEQKQLEKKNMK